MTFAEATLEAWRDYDVCAYTTDGQAIYGVLVGGGANYLVLLRLENREIINAAHIIQVIPRMKQDDGS